MEPGIRCPRCKKRGFLTSRMVKSIHYGCVTIVSTPTGPEVVSIHKPRDRERAKQLGLVFEREVHNPRVGKGQENKIVVERLKQTYGSWVHWYVGHYDSESYTRQMDDYRAGKRKSRPNGRRWCYLRKNDEQYLREVYQEPLAELARITRKEITKDIPEPKFSMYV